MNNLKLMFYWLLDGLSGGPIWKLMEYLTRGEVTVLEDKEGRALAVYRVGFDGKIWSLIWADENIATRHRKMCAYIEWRMR